MAAAYYRKRDGKHFLKPKDLYTCVHFSFSHCIVQQQVHVASPKLLLQRPSQLPLISFLSNMEGATFLNF